MAGAMPRRHAAGGARGAGTPSPVVGAPGRPRTDTAASQGSGGSAPIRAVASGTIAPMPKHMFTTLKGQKTFVHDFVEGHRFSSGVAERGLHQRGSRCVLHPCSWGRLAWDFLAVSFIVYQLLLIPFELAFLQVDYGSDLDLDWQLLVEAWIGLFFLLDIVLNFRTGHITESGRYVSDCRGIMRQYCTQPPFWFALDVAATVPSVLGALYAIYGGSGTAAPLLDVVWRGIRILRLTRILRVPRAMKVADKMYQLAIAYRKTSIALRVLQLAVLATLLVHALTCLWRAISRFDAHVAQAGFDVDGFDMYEQYIFAQWWLVTMLVTGEGMSGPTTVRELLLWTFLGITSIILHNMGLAAFLAQSNAFFEDSKVLRRRMYVAKRFLASHQLQPELQTRLLSAVKFLCIQERNPLHEFQDEVEKHLSEDLRKEIYGDIFDPLLKRFPPFADTHAPAKMVRFRRKLALHAEIRRFNERDMIIEEGDIADTMIFVIDGTGKLLSANGTLCHLVSAGWWFGEQVCFHCNNPDVPARAASVIATSPCRVLEISRQVFQEAIEGFGLQNWRDRHCRMCDANMPWGCQACGRKDHWLTTCPFSSPEEPLAFWGPRPAGRSFVVATASGGTSGRRDTPRGPTKNLDSMGIDGLRALDSREMLRPHGRTESSDSGEPPRAKGARKVTFSASSEGDDLSSSDPLEGGSAKSAGRRPAATSGSSAGAEPIPEVDAEVSCAPPPQETVAADAGKPAACFSAAAPPPRLAHTGDEDGSLFGAGASQKEPKLDTSREPLLRDMVDEFAKLRAEVQDQLRVASEGFQHLREALVEAVSRPRRSSAVGGARGSTSSRPSRGRRRSLPCPVLAPGSGGGGGGAETPRGAGAQRSGPAPEDGQGEYRAPSPMRPPSEDDAPADRRWRRDGWPELGADSVSDRVAAALRSEEPAAPPWLPFPEVSLRRSSDATFGRSQVDGL